MYKIKSYGKINLSLEVLGKREDGYHNIDTLMNSIDLFDEISIKEISGEDLILKSDNFEFPYDSSNLIYKAWEILKNYRNKAVGLEIFVKKNIPVAAGLAGGTSNACTVMKALNEIWNLKLSKEELIDLSKPLGADSTFFFYEGLVRAEGIGEKITKFEDKLNYPLILINIGKPISSKEVYSKINNYSTGIVESIVSNINDEEFLFKNAFNSMEAISFKIYPELSSIKQELINLGADLSLMSGSGPTIFGIFKDEKKRDLVYTKLLNKYNYVIKSKMI
jgi:4-diphosphocytidyl-2-C-methyl-D-erythritol kinase